ncbi:MAG: ParB/RepB/Spo0J family partition protein [Acidobacteriaceae bacterium]|nr:ParB/RepB/Spo0J family partition protein [Acidobacteriaceae bacterium]
MDKQQSERSQRKALGKGLSALLPTRHAAPQVHTPAPDENAYVLHIPADLPEEFEEFHNVPLDHIEPGQQQPRESFDGEKLDQLAQSIRINGLIQPITVQKIAPHRYRIIAGERRWRAARIAGLGEIPCLVRTADRTQTLELALIENIQREDLNPIEIATAFERLSSQHGLSHEQIAERTGKQRSTVTNFLRLLNLGAAPRNELIAGRITMGHARAILNVADPAEQAKVCEDIINNRLSVRETEALVKKLNEPAVVPESSRREHDAHEVQAGPQIDPNVRAALDEMAMVLGTKVRLSVRPGGGGRLEIEYYSQDDLDRIYSVIVKQ